MDDLRLECNELVIRKMNIESEIESYKEQVRYAEVLLSSLFCACQVSSLLPQALGSWHGLDCCLIAIVSISTFKVMSARYGVSLDSEE